MSRTKEELLQAYEKATHAVQSGVAMEMNFNSRSTEPKHLRVGIDLSKAEQGGLVRLLIKKGVFTEDEYVEAITEAVEDERRLYEDRLSHLLGKKITLA